jgi:hypothetical protein
MIITHLKGGLGNQMFQYACGYSLGKEYNSINKLDITYYSSIPSDHTKRSFELSQFNISSKITKESEIKALKGYRQRKKFPRISFIKTCLYYIIYSGRDVNYTILKEENYKIWKWLREHYPNYKKNTYISIFKPKGENLSIKVAIWGWVLLQKVSLENTFLWVYSKP